MSRQNKNKYILFEFLYFIILFFIIPSVFLYTRPGPDSLEYDHLTPVDVLHPVSQAIFFSQNGFNSISLLLKNPALLNRQNFIISISDNNGQIVRQMKFNGYNIGDPGWLPFKFNPLNNSRNQQYRLNLTTSDPSVNTISIYADNTNFTYKTTYKSSSFSDSFKINFNNQINNFKQRDPFLTGIYLIILLALNMLFIL